MPSPIESVTTAALSAALDAAARRHAAVATNIANANTEGYAPLRMSFADRLDEARSGFREKGWLEPTHVDALRGTVEQAASAAGQTERVQLDAEVTELARNAVQFQTLAQLLSRHLGVLATAAADGRK